MGELAPTRSNDFEEARELYDGLQFSFRYRRLNTMLTCEHLVRFA